MKKLFTFFAAVAFVSAMAVGLSACSSNANKAKVVGEWELVKECNGDGDCKYRENMYTTFREDGTMWAQDKRGKRHEGTWSVDGDILTIGEDGRDIQYTIVEINDGNMVLQRSGSRGKIYFMKQ